MKWWSCPASGTVLDCGVQATSVPRRMKETAGRNRSPVGLLGFGQRFTKMSVLAGDGGPSIVFRDELASPVGDFAALGLRDFEKVHHGVGDGRHVAFGERSEPVLFDLGKVGSGCGDEVGAGGEGFEDDDGEAFGQGGEDEGVGTLEEGGFVGSIDRADVGEAVCESGLPDGFEQAGGEGGLIRSGEDGEGVGVGFGGLNEGVGEDVGAFGGVETAEVEVEGFSFCAVKGFADGGGEVFRGEGLVEGSGMDAVGDDGGGIAQAEGAVGGGFGVGEGEECRSVADGGFFDEVDVEVFFEGAVGERFGGITTALGEEVGFAVEACGSGKGGRALHEGHVGVVDVVPVAVLAEPLGELRGEVAADGPGEVGDAEALVPGDVTGVVEDGDAFDLTGGAGGNVERFMAIIAGGEDGDAVALADEFFGEGHTAIERAAKLIGGLVGGGVEEKLHGCWFRCHSTVASRPSLKE